MNPLIGKIITKIWLSEDSRAIKFDLSDGTNVVAQCDGDCCSHTWIEDLLNPSLALNSAVTSVGDLDLPEHLRQPTKTGNFEEEMQYYGFYIETLNGRFVIAYRNSSNGYYGGNLSWPGEHFYGGVFDQNVPCDKWKEIVE